MKLDEIVTWYQKKIGTYDKQQWEKTVEQKILDGFSSVTLKNAKLKTELIDVDLVRGSTFPKAKPKQTLLTVIRLAILRYLFLPIYAQWWVRQTSPNIFGLLLFLYITQMINWAVYTFNVHRLENGDDISAVSNATNTVASDEDKSAEDHVVSLAELLIPMVLSLLLSLIHSQIVATNSVGGLKPKHRRYSNTNPSGGKVARSGEGRVRRRKKLVKLRSQDALDVNSINATSTQRKLNTAAALKFNAEPLSALSTHVSSTAAAATTAICPSGSNNIIKQETFATTTNTSAIIPRNISSSNSCPITAKTKHDLSSNESSNFHSPTNNTSVTLVSKNTDPLLTLSNQKKRNVNWHSPIHNYAIETQEKQQQTSPQMTASSSAATSDASTPSSSTNNSNRTTTSDNTLLIDVSVQEFYDDLIRQTLVVSTAISTSTPTTTTTTTTSPSSNSGSLSSNLNAKRSIGDDDGFESLNGKSSSGEETNTCVNTVVMSGNVVGGGGVGGGGSGGAAVACKNQLRLRLNANGIEAETSGYRRKTALSSESDFEAAKWSANCADKVFIQSKKIRTQTAAADASSDETDEEGGDDADVVSSPASTVNTSNYNECTTSATEWLGVTTNSEECSYSSELEHSDDYKKHQSDDEYDGYDLDFTPTTILNPHGTTADRISCTIWDQREIKKAQMSVLEISSCIIERVESMPETNDYIYIGIVFSCILSLVPSFCRLCEVTIDAANPSDINYLDVPMLLWQKASFSFLAIFRFAYGHTQWERTVLIISCVQRLCLTLILFIIFSVAERTFKQRFLYAKLFSHLTSSRRARKSNLPHFRLNKVRNIKTWLSVRSYLKKRGPQRSVDVIVSAAFIVTLLLLAFLSVEWLKDSVHLHSHLNLEALVWSTTIGIFLLRFMTLGNKIHHKYRSVSVLITEQINLYLQIEQKPKKKDDLMVSNSVLKLAADLLKELESPFKISGLSANPYLFTTIKVVILSALSGVLSEMLGFKLKLHKIKIK